MNLAGLLVLFLSFTSLFAQAPATMGVGEIRAGMKGPGRTGFQGGKFDRFECEVLWV